MDPFLDINLDASPAFQPRVSDALRCEVRRAQTNRLGKTSRNKIGPSAVPSLSEQSVLGLELQPGMYTLWVLPCF